MSKRIKFVQICTKFVQTIKISISKLRTLNQIFVFYIIFHYIVKKRNLNLK